MIKELYTAALGMIPQQIRLEVAANNIANANTVGFKRESVFQDALIDARDNLNHVSGEAEGADSSVTRYFDTTQGAFQKTNDPLDVAIDGKGYFVVQDDNGKEYLTRAGHFSLSTDGKLVTADGKTVLSDQGPLYVRDMLERGTTITDEKPVEMHIKENGEVFVNQESRGHLTVVDVDDPQALNRISATLFEKNDDVQATPVPEEELHLKQGHLENSNVNIISEMVNMIQIQRMFELGQKVISTNDGTIDRSLDIGRFT